jgi:hypothetical protein
MDEVEKVRRYLVQGAVSLLPVVPAVSDVVQKWTNVQTHGLLSGKGKGFYFGRR